MADTRRLTRDIANVTMDLNDVETIDVNALGGADTITVNDLSRTDVKQVKIDLARAGSGGDGSRHDRHQRDQRRRRDHGHQQQRRGHRVGLGARR